MSRWLAFLGLQVLAHSLRGSRYRSHKLANWWEGLRDAPSGPTSIGWKDVGVPRGEAKTRAQMSDEVEVNGSIVLRGSKSLDENYHLIVKVGQTWRDTHKYDGDTYGVMMTKPQRDGSTDIVYRTSSGHGKKKIPLTSDSPDFTSIIHKDKRTFMISHMEDAPGGTFLLELAQHEITGHLTLTKSTFMDWSRYGGLRFPCSGMLSPWNTHLGAEEYEPDAKIFFNTTRFHPLDNVSDCSLSWTEACRNSPWSRRHSPVDHMRFHAIYPEGDVAGYDQAVRTFFNPYQIGWPFEAGVTQGEYFAHKLMAVGRRSGELPYVMPDRRTLYLTDDGTNTYLSLFQADTADNLNAGILYCARVHQTSNEGGGTFELSWLSMGHTQHDDIEVFVNKKPVFNDMFDETTPERQSDVLCPHGFNVSHASGVLECLRVKPGMDVYASRLESRRYASLLGCTTEWNKMEGFAFSEETGEAFVAITEVGKGMEDHAEASDFDSGTGNHVRLAPNKCGCVYKLSQFGADWFAGEMKAAICGQPVEGKFACDTAGIANPDNIATIHGHASLLIGEDSSLHENNMLWHYDLRTEELKSRIASVPSGGEVCSPNFYPDIGGFSYLTMIVQHPAASTFGGAGLGFASWKSPGYTAPAPGDGSSKRRKQVERVHTIERHAEPEQEQTHKSKSCYLPSKLQVFVVVVLRVVDYLW